MEKEYSAEQIYESFQNPKKCRELIRMLLNSGLLSEILQECGDYAEENQIDEEKL